MGLPTEKVGSWVTEPDAHWFGRCDGCGKRRLRLDLYDCYPEGFLDGGGGFQWQCAGCMIGSLTEKLERRLAWCRLCDRMKAAGDGEHKTGCRGGWEEFTEEMAKEFFNRIEEIAKETPNGSD